MSMSILKGIHRRMLGIGVRDEVIARAGFVAGGDDRPAIVLPGNPDVVALFDDFLGDLVTDEWAYVEGDTGYSGAIQTGTNGVFRITGSETQAVAPDTAAAALTAGLVKNWKANMGGPKNGRLRMSARVKLETVTRTAEGGRTHAFVGFSDSGGAELPAWDTGAGVISAAADLVGFLFSPGGDTGWSLVSVKSTAGDSGDQLVVAGASYGPSANTYTTLEVEVRSGNSDTGGAAHFWIDGKKVGRIDSPVGSAIAMTPWVGMFVQDTGAAQFMDVDYIACSAPRDTGL
jgi:hypothetical protein